MKNVQKETRNQEMRLKDFGCKAFDAFEMFVVLATAIMLVGSSLTAKTAPASEQHEKLCRCVYNTIVYKHSTFPQLDLKNYTFPQLKLKNYVFP